MNRWIVSTRYIVLGMFLASCLGVTAYEWWFVWPAQKCDKAGAWWDPADHQCLTPMPIWRMTGRPPADARPAAKG
jgi:hypothetical protein